MEQIFVPCDECGYSYSRQNQESGMCRICEFKKMIDLQNRLQNVYGECGGLLEKVIGHLEQHEGVDLPEPVFRARLLTDDEVDRWERYKDLEEIFRSKITDSACEFLKDKEEFAKWLDRNKWIAIKCDEYARAEEQGKLLKLPCAVGDRIYVIDTDERLSDKEIKVYDIENIVILSDGTILLKHDFYDGVICELENIVTDKPYLDYYRCFLTREEAEAELKELEGEKNEAD